MINNRVLLFFACVVGCSVLYIGCDDDDGGIIETPPPPVGGTWELAITNADEAIFTGCTGDLQDLEELTLAEALAVAPECNIPDPVASQSEDMFMFSLQEASYTCSDGSSGSVSGGGSVAV